MKNGKLRNVNNKLTHTKQMKKQKGITLIALIVTIILMLILAGITILSFTESGLFGQAIRAKEQAKISKYEEAIRLAEKEAIFENNYSENTTENILNNMKNILSTQSLFKNASFSVEKENSIMEVITSEGYVFKVTLNETGYIEIEYLGKLEEITPVITILSTSNTTNSVTVKVTTEKNAGGKIEFYIAKNDASYSKKETISNVENDIEYEYTFVGLEQEEIYKVKVIAVTTKNIKAETEKTNIQTKTVSGLEKEDVVFTYIPSNWTNEDIKVTAKINEESTIDTTGYTLKLTTDLTTSPIEWENASEGITIATENTPVYAILVDSTNQLGKTYATGNVDNIDKTAPCSFIIAKSDIGVNSFTLSTTFEDNESGLGKIIWYYKRPEDTNWQSEEKIYTELKGSIAGTTGSITKTYSINDMTIGGEIQAYAIGYDVAGNSITTTNANENNPLTFNTETYTISYDANGGEGAPENQIKYYGVDIQLSSTEPTKSGHTFLGWAEDSTATSSTYVAGTTYSSNNNTTLYAIWQAQTLSVSYSVNRSSGGNCNWVDYSNSKGIGVRTYVSCNCSVSTSVNTTGWNYITVSYSIRGDNGSTSANVGNGTKYALNGASSFSVNLSASAKSDGYNEAWASAYINSITLSMN